MLSLGNGRFDAVVAGGGIYGILLALEGASRGERVLLVERDDFGGGTTSNHMRTIHGGLRYLQSLNVRRAIVSNRQRQWWLRYFPDLIRPMPCLMPLYGEGLRRPQTFRAAFALSRLLGLHDRSDAGRRTGVISSAEVRGLLEYRRDHDLDRGALWHDAFMPRPHRVVAELLHWAEAAGAVLHNRMELFSAMQVSKNDGADAWRLSVRNRSGETLELASRWIINATGPATDETIRRITGRHCGRVFIPTLAWGMLLDRPPVSECSLAIAPPGKNRGTYFVHPYHGFVLAGTGHAGIPPDGPLPSGPSEPQLQKMLSDLDEALPGFAPIREQVRHVFWGVLPGLRAGAEQLLTTPVIIDHGLRDRAPGAWTVLGVKFTEAPSVASRVWNQLTGPRTQDLPARPPPAPVPSFADARVMSDRQLTEALRRIAATEWQPSACDLAWRRTDLWMDEAEARRVDQLEPFWKSYESVSEYVPPQSRLD
ncbi:MAG TPA: FAD-dependent oxidoreductase [Woeseiaceae bacterium]